MSVCALVCPCVPLCALVCPCVSVCAQCVSMWLSGPCVLCAEEGEGGGSGAGVGVGGGGAGGPAGSSRTQGRPTLSLVPNAPRNYELLSMNFADVIVWDVRQVAAGQVRPAPVILSRNDPSSVFTADLPHEDTSTSKSSVWLQQVR